MVERVKLIERKPHRFKKGDPRFPGAGRKKGQPNHMTKEVREVIQAVFDRIGEKRKVSGIEAMTNWALRNNKNLTAFYTQIYTKLLPTQGTKESEPMLLQRIERVIIHHDPERARQGLPQLTHVEQGQIVDGEYEEVGS